ncbi:unnamed protein product [Linum trigynum]|uniref:Uncharacterized protein n=1 Tax=Linum trigynum TaxID=586398 RepID=A0AAV2G4F8_9ROSI
MKENNSEQAVGSVFALQATVNRSPLDPSQSLCTFRRTKRRSGGETFSNWTPAIPPSFLQRWPPDISASSNGSLQVTSVQSSVVIFSYARNYKGS